MTYPILLGRVLTIDNNIILSKTIAYECRHCGHIIEMQQRDLGQITSPQYCEQQDGGCGRKHSDEWVRIDRLSEMVDCRILTMKNKSDTYLVYDFEMNKEVVIGSELEIKPGDCQLKKGTKSTFLIVPSSISITHI